MWTKGRRKLEIIKLLIAESPEICLSQRNPAM